MHKELLKLLHDAEGESRRVVVVFLDIRGFSSFAKIAESTDTAEFLKTIYIKILDDFFPDAEFFKPTGDGLLILLTYERENLTEVVQSAVGRSISIVEKFEEFCAGDEMINFDVPAKIGVGLARGSATRLAADGKALDYSGRPLNLASRLMDLARPFGVVFDTRFGFPLLDKETQALFRKDSAYVKGLAESKPMEVFCLQGYVEIPEHNKRPLDGFVRFSQPEEKLTFKALEDRGNFRHHLSQEPARTDNIELHLWYPKILSDGTKHETFRHVTTLPATFGTAAGKSFAVVDYGSKVAELKNRGIKGNWQVSTVLEYSVVPEDAASEEKSGA
jgi:class 3 adenylate cyclase